MMDVDVGKETDGAEEVSFDQLPNELLLMIFRDLTFRQLLQATAVCHRWNELAFFLVQDRVSLRLDSLLFDKNILDWNPIRTYPAVSFRSYLDKDLNFAPLASLADNVRTLKLTRGNATDGGLIKFLRPFDAVETLVIQIDQLIVMKSVSKFLQHTRGLLPSVRHLTMRCRYAQVARLLAEVAPRLVSLDLELLPRLLPYFYDCRFDCLESLTLRFLTPMAHTWILPGKQALINFLRQMSALRKLVLFVDTDYSAFDVAIALTSLEELTLKGNFKTLYPDTLNDLSQLTNLRSLTIDVQSLMFCQFRMTNPLPTVETLNITGSLHIALEILVRQFPNLKILNTNSKFNDVRTLVGSPWQNSMEDLTIEVTSINHETIACFTVLQKLQRLNLHLMAKPNDGLLMFASLASMDSMRELHLHKLHGIEWWEAAAELARIVPRATCAIYIGRTPIESFLRLMEQQAAWLQSQAEA